MSPTPEWCMYLDRWSSGTCGSDIQAFAPLIGIVLLLGVYFKFKEYVPSRKEMWAGGLIAFVGISLVFIGLFPTVEYTGGRYIPEMEIQSGELSESGEIVLNIFNNGERPLDESDFALRAAYGSQDIQAYENISKEYKTGSGFRCMNPDSEENLVPPEASLKCFTGLLPGDRENITIRVAGLDRNIRVRDNVFCQMQSRDLECR